MEELLVRLAKEVRDTNSKVCIFGIPHQFEEINLRLVNKEGQQHVKRCRHCGKVKVG